MVSLFNIFWCPCCINDLVLIYPAVTCVRDDLNNKTCKN